MASHALTSLLHKHGIPHVKCLALNEAASLRNNTLLIDASSVCNLLRKRCGVADLASVAFHSNLYKATITYFRGLLRTGLRLVLCFESALVPVANAEEFTGRLGAAPGMATVQMVFQQAVLDLDLECLHSVHGVTKLLLAWYMANKESVYAVLTCDSDFFVFSMDKIIDANDAVIDPNSVTFHIWSCKEAWQKLYAFATGRMPTPVSLMERAQVAAMLGNSSSKDVRHRLGSRLSSSPAAGEGKARVMSATLAGLEVLRRGGGVALDLDFFKKEPLNMKNFDEASLGLFNGAVQQYLDNESWARTPEALNTIRLSTDSVPGLSAELAGRLTQNVVPPLLKSIACRGLYCLGAEEASSPVLQALRQKAASQLGSDVVALYSFESKEHYIPVANLPAVPATESCSGASVEKGSSLALTASSIRAAQPSLSEALVLPYAVLLHAMDPDPEAYSAAAVRELLLPGVPPLACAELAGAERTLAARPPWQGAVPTAGVVDVGSSLNQEDWDDIDAKEVVGKTQSSAGFMLMAKIQPWDPSALTVPSLLPMKQLFRFFYNWAQKQESPWKELMKSCFPEQYKETKKGDKAEVKALKKELTSQSCLEILAALRKEGQKGGGPSAAAARYAALWADRLQSFLANKTASGMISLWRDAAMAGPESIQWITAQHCWSVCNIVIKKQALVEAWSCDNRPQLNNGGPPMMYPHQQSLMDLMDRHLHQVETEVKVQKQPQLLPLHVILSTPTGSGKTFTAVMTYLKLLKEPQPSEGASIAAAARKGHPDTIIVYSVPTKQVLKRVGQECEAHKIVYWTAAKVKELHEVRRPYSIRTLGGKRALGGSLGAGPMPEQLEKCSAQGSLNHDMGGGTPSFIIADLHSTAAIVQAAATAPPDAFYHHSKILLYFDEPNMGIHLDPEVEHVVRSIMLHAPVTTVLASATLGSWDELPPWWKGEGQPATRTVISQEPYNLPMSRLCVLDKSKGQLVSVNALQLFRSYDDFVRVLGQSPRLRVLMLRHFTPAQANELVGLKPEALNLDASKTDEESEGSEWLSTILGQDVASLREGLMEPELQNLSAERFQQLRDQAWVEPPKETLGLREVVSKQGVTLIATLDPRTLALEAAGKWSDEARWSETSHEIRAKISAALVNQREAAKASRRTQKKDDDDGPAPAADSGSSVVTLRTGLWIDLEDAKSTEIDVLVMLARGVAYACCDGTEPLVKRLYQQALLYVPEKAGSQPPINILVVDYSSVYGTDCPAVDVIILCEDLGQHMSWEDHQQFIGRLRRDGTAIYPSLKLLRWATMRSVVGGASDVDLFRSTPEALSKAFLLASKSAANADAATAAAETELLDIAKSTTIGRSTTGRAEVACSVLSTILRSLLPLPPLDDAITEDPALAKKEKTAAAVKLLKAAIALLKQFGPLKPIQLLKLARTANEQTKLLQELDKLCSCDTKVIRNSVLVPTSPGGCEYLPVVAKLMEWLYDEDVFKEEVVLTWAKTSSRTAFRKAVEPFVEWLEEADSEEED